jgi:hypothetical protein
VRFRPAVLLLALALALPALAVAQEVEDTIPDPAEPRVDTIPDPVRAFVEGFNPEDGDFFAHPPDRTDLLRMRLDVDGDGRPDLAVSESSMFGIGAGPWLLFRRLSPKGYRYLGEIFAGPGALRAQRVGSANELVAGTPISAARTHLIRYRVTADTVVEIGERDTTGAMASAPGTTLEHCPVQDYQNGAAQCWQAGASPRN